VERVTSDELARAVEGRTVPRQFRDTVADRPDAVSLRWQEGDDWLEWTWRDYAERATAVAAGLADLGVERGHRVVLMIRNRPDFHVCDMAALLCGATPVSIYNSSSPEQMQYLAGHCEASVAIVEDIGFLERLLKVRGELPELRHVVVIDDPDGLAPDDVVPFAQLAGADPLDLDRAADVARPDDLATLVYTSGTTGPPKGAMLSHFNLAWLGESNNRMLPVDLGGKRFISYLPMAHILERLLSHYSHVAYGTEVTTCPDPSLLAPYLGQVHPQFFVGVPRVWEKLYGGIQAMTGADPEKKADFDRAVEVGRTVALARLEDRKVDAGTQAAWEQAEAETFSLVRALVGLDACEVAATGAAPITREVFEFFLALGVPLTEGYGMTESSGIITGEYERPRPGSVGRPIPGVELRLGDDGEVLARGGNVFQGYLKDPERTAETVDPDGWLHTGDIGEIDDDGYLHIVDRKKELIITAGGKNISPANIEAALKAFPLVGQAAAIGDNRPYIAALVVLDADVAPGWAASEGIETSGLAELARHPRVQEEIQGYVDEANREFSRVEQVKRFVVLGEEWVPDSLELTPTMKLKRRGIAEKYAEEIESLYS
jgi:long-chain acyl-CoA synthetase